MIRNLRHFHLRNLGKAEPFAAKGNGGPGHASNVPNRVAHAQALLQALDVLPNVAEAGLPGLYLEVFSRTNERLKIDSLNASGLTLLRYEDDGGGNHQKTATVFATPKGLDNLRKKIDQFRTENSPDKEKDGVLIPGRPKNADLVQSMALITEAGLRALWRSPAAQFPAGEARTCWEIWLEPATAAAFLDGAGQFGVVVGAEQLFFPEDLVVIGEASPTELALAVRRLAGVRALALPSVSAEFFARMEVKEQAEWVADLSARSRYIPRPDPGYVAILDTGVSLAHPLIQPALDGSDQHAAYLAWGLEDVKGHGTEMAGLALFGDLTGKLQQLDPVEVRNRLESVKLMPDTGENPHHLLGVVTRRGVDAVEKAGGLRRRTYMLATTTSDDTPHDGAPTSWSSELDQLAAGVSGRSREKRLILISAGNTDNYTFGASHYLEVCDHPDNEIESPAQAWNAICVGAYTEKRSLPPGAGLTPLAPFGDLSPSSRTASWTSQWPLKPDVVLEGGNWAAWDPPPPMRHPWLSLLTTHSGYPQRSFRLTYDTSAATALAAKGITELWSDYPNLWPETVRGLYVGSARWTPQMLSHLPAEPQKGAYAVMFQRYGYGVPDLDRARRSASNALTLIVEDTITPYGLSKKTGEDVHKEMKVFELPWPVEALRTLGNTLVTLRVTLSSFVAPNPSEASRGTRYRYASHNLRFKLNRADEDLQQFQARISKAVERTEGPASTESDVWDFGPNRRDVGSLHIDQLSCKASDLARRSLIAVHPVTGWWKSKALLKQELPIVRYSLIVEIDAGGVETDLYTEVQAAIEALVIAGAVVAV